MSYDKQTWADGSAGGTPITAARLGHLEDGVDAAHDLVATAQSAAVAAQSDADAAQVAAANAQSTADSALAAAGGDPGNLVPEVEFGIPADYVLTTFGDGTGDGEYAWAPPSFNTDGADAGEVPVSSGDGIWMWGTAPVAAHSHDDRYYTETESDARYYTKTQGDNRYIAKGDVASFDVLTAAEMAALIAGGTTVADRTYYVIG